MKTAKEISSWLRANCGQHSLAPLTSTDVTALVASVNLTPLICHEHAPDELFAAYGAIVRQMQPQTRWLAFHAIAIELDWPMRFTIWQLADLSEEDKPKGKAAYEPGGAKRG
jgi:hypothetical protein